MADGPNALTSPTLLGRLRQSPDDPAAWDEFSRRYGAMIHRWCRNWGLQLADADDVVQNVLLELSRQMREFEYDPAGSFRAWLKTVARRAWIRYRDSRRRQQGSPAHDAVLDELCDPTAEDDLIRRLEEEYERELLERALARVRLRVKPSTFDSFRLTALEGLSGKDAAERIGVPITHVFVAKANVQKMIREEITDLDRGAAP
ncbi:MAG: sigma-70 family RNA polymerase sigma factor [Gemmataceae bacterium]|nr:sigma-70 family RNA polymerase sigma factor [Gemmataceae bacterium]